MSLKDKNGRCIIFTACANLDVTGKTIIINNDDYVIAADEGFSAAIKFAVPNIVVGDFDSINISEIPDNIEIKEFPQKKDDTDTILAIKEGLNKGYKDFIIYGGIGGRLEHTIANIQALKFLNEHNAKGVLRNDYYDIFFIKNTKINIENTNYEYVSLLSFSKESEGVTIKGFEFPLVDAVLYNFYPLGISNKMLEKTAEITVKNGELLIICTKLIT